MQRVTILYDASQAVLQTFDLDEVLNQILSIVRNYFNLQDGSILLVDEDGQNLYVRTHFGSREFILNRRIPIGTGITGAAAEKKRPIYVPDVSQDPRYIPGVAATRSELAIPLMVQDQVVGVLDCQSDEVNHFDNETVDLLTLFAAQASIGLQNAKLYSMLERRAAQMEAINSLAKQATVELHLNELLERFCHQLPQAFPIERVAVFAREDDQVSLVASNDPSSNTYLQSKIASCPHMADALASDVSTTLACTDPCPRDAGAEVLLPLVSFGKNIGVLYCASSKIERFNRSDMQVLESVADILATAMQNAVYVERVRELAYRDGLTAIFNRRYFELRLVDEILRMERYGAPCTVLMIDIDKFKDVNDEFGHLLGDEVLKNTAVIFQRQLRKIDAICRFGGEEFAIVLPSTNLDAGLAVAEKLRRSFAQFEFSGIPRPVTISIGVASCPEHGKDRDALVRAADMALYQAKQAGRNRVEASNGATAAIDGRN